MTAAISSMSAVSMTGLRYTSPQHKLKATDQSRSSSQAELQKRTEAHAKEQRNATDAFARERDEAGKGLKLDTQTFMGIAIEEAGRLGNSPCSPLLMDLALDAPREGALMGKLGNGRGTSGMADGPDKQLETSLLNIQTR
jgi:hypothetical protein